MVYDEFMFFQKKKLYGSVRCDTVRYDEIRCCTIIYDNLLFLLKELREKPDVAQKEAKYTLTGNLHTLHYWPYEAFPEI